MRVSSIKKAIESYRLKIALKATFNKNVRVNASRIIIIFSGKYFVIYSRFTKKKYFYESLFRVICSLKVDGFLASCHDYATDDVIYVYKNIQ